MIFAYSARDPMGRTVEGELDAETAEQASRELIGRALTVRWIRAVAPKRAPASSPLAASAGRPQPQDRMTPHETAPETIEDAFEKEFNHVEEGAPTEKRGGFSPWSVVIFLLFLSQLLRAC